MRSAYFNLLPGAACLVLSACVPPTPVDPGNIVAPVVRHPAPDRAVVADPAPTRIVEHPDTVPSETPPTELWKRLRQGLALDYDTSLKVVDKRARWYAHKDRQTGLLHRAFSRAQFYLPHILDEVERRGLPTELALLPLVESAYHPYARSNKRAVGLWQFIPGTGRQYGLQRNWWYEGRRDVYAATLAALDYLEHLHKEMQGDWLLALAAYNTGEKNVHRAIQRNRKQGKSTEFWALRLPRETRGYVPNLLAVTEIVKHPGRYGVEVDSYQARQIGRVQLDAPLDLALAAELADIDMNTLRSLNPGLRRWMTPPQGPHYLLLPRDRVALFHERLAEVPASERVRWIVHPVRRNDTLHRVAAHYGLDDVQGLAVINQLGKHIPAGRKTLRVPAMMYPEKRYRSSLYKRAFEGTTPEVSGGERFVYQVKNGDSLWLIGKRYGVSIAQLRRWNPKTTSRRFLRPGNHLVLWLQRAPEGSNATAKRPRRGTGKAVPARYTIKSGDSLWLIARRFNTSIPKLAQLNGLDPQRYLRPGRTIHIPTAGNTAPNAQVVKYVVRKGDSLWLIAKRFNTSIPKLRSWNRLHRRHHLQPGQQLKIYLPTADDA